MRENLKISLLEEFLILRNWRKTSKTDKFNVFTAPPDVDSSQQFELTVPLSANERGLNAGVTSILNTLAEIYEQSVERIYTVLSEKAEIIAIRLAGEDTKDGSASLAEFETFLDHIQKALIHSATFTIQNLSMNADIPPQAEEYIQQCRILQTEKGSFIANIQVPENVILQPKDLLLPEITSYDATRRFEKTLTFTVDEVLNSNSDICTDHFLQTHAANINIDILDNIEKILTKTQASEIDFSFFGRKQSHEIRAQNLTQQRKDTITQFTRFAKEKVVQLIEINTTGSVVELRSRNPSKNRNTIVISSRQSYREIFISVTLDNPTYQVAIQAHRTGKSIRIQGQAIQLKTQLRIEKLDSLTII